MTTGSIVPLSSRNIYCSCRQVRRRHLTTSVTQSPCLEKSASVEDMASLPAAGRESQACRGVNVGLLHFCLFAQRIPRLRPVQSFRFAPYRSEWRVLLYTIFYKPRIPRLRTGTIQRIACAIGIRMTLEVLFCYYHAMFIACEGRAQQLNVTQSPDTSHWRQVNFFKFESAHADLSDLFCSHSNNIVG
jgi:hypothetical protein